MRNDIVKEDHAGEAALSAIKLSKHFGPVKALEIGRASCRERV